MPQPQSTVFFLLMMASFGLLVWWLAVARQVVFRVLAACLAFIPAVLFGVAAVNKYYNYYQTWSAAISDLTGRGIQTVSSSQGHYKTDLTTVLGHTFYRPLAAQQGATLRLTVNGSLSHLTRATYVYLPPQYFQPAYRTYKFPVIELIHGYPGAPEDWITVLGVTTILSGMLQQGMAKPAVLVMPDANGGRGISLQCLNQVQGPQDATFLAHDVPSYISQVLRVWSPGRTWAIAGYSEGGFCAANLGLQYGGNFGLAGVLSGYFRPGLNRQSQPKRQIDPFAGSLKLRRANTPVDELSTMPPGTLVPHFWLGAGERDLGDVRAAMLFSQQLQIRQPDVTVKLVPGGHQGSTWRLLLPPMLSWMTSRLAFNVSLNESRAWQARHQHVAPVHHPVHKVAPAHHRQPPRPKARHSRPPRHPAH